MKNFNKIEKYERNDKMKIKFEEASSRNEVILKEQCQ